VGEAAVVEGEVGEDAGFFVGAVLLDEGAFVFCLMDSSALHEDQKSDIRISFLVVLIIPLALREGWDLSSKHALLNHGTL
jgi:hypothetical protein